MPNPQLAKELLARLFNTGMEAVNTPLVPEWTTPDRLAGSALIEGADLGADNPLVNKVWPGGMQIPGLRAIYNEGVRPATSVLGLLMAAGGGGKGATPAARANNIVRTPEGIILRDETAGILQRVMAKLRAGAPLESIPLEERQKAMGMDDVVYHGTKNKYVPRGLVSREGVVQGADEYPMLKPNQGVDVDYGIHADHDPIVAHTAISANKILDGNVESGRYATGDRIFPLRARVANPMTLPDIGKWNDPFAVLNKLGKNPENLQQRELREAAQEILERTGGVNKYGGIVPLKQEAAMEAWADTFPKILQKNGYDSVTYANSNEGTGKHSTMLLNANQVRMPWAKFDPRKMMAGDLLAFNKNKIKPQASAEDLGDTLFTPFEPSPKAAGQEVMRLMKIRAARKGVDLVREEATKLLDEGFGKKRTTDIELK